MAYLFPNPPPFFFCQYTNQKDGCLMGFSIYPFGDGENGRMTGLVFVFCFFLPLALFPWYLAVVGRRRRSIWRKSRRPTHIYVWITFLLFCCSFYGLISVRFGGLFILFSISSGQVQGFCFFLLPFPFYFPNAPYCLLPPLHIWVYPLLRCWFFLLRPFSSIVSFELTIPYFIS